jgi:small subunit ribosomal protein S4
MARYTGPKCKLCRREGTKLFLKGDRCYTERCAIEKRNYPPGERGRGRYSKRSGYRTQLREKQKLRRMYQIFEAQFRTYFKRADQMKGITGENLLRLLGKRVNVPSYNVTPGDRIMPREKSRALLVIEESLKSYGSRGTVPYISVDVSKKEGILSELPTRDVMPIPIEENLIVELYSK